MRGSKTEFAQLRRELHEAHEQQTATLEVLQAISSSPGDLQLIFASMLEKAVRICDAKFGAVYRCDGDVLRFVTMHNAPPGLAALGSHAPFRPSPKHYLGRMMASKTVVQVADIRAEQGYIERRPEYVTAVELGGVRTYLAAPMLRHNDLIGVFLMGRQEVRPFTGRQIALVKNFAAQAVIAIENARLFNETQEALEQQKASSDILRVISSSLSDAQPVFDKILASCKHLFGSDETAVLLLDGADTITLGAYVGKQHDAVAASFPAPLEKSPAGRAIREQRVVHYTDVANDPQLTRTVRRVAQLAGYESMAYAPMLSNGRGIGAIGVSRNKGSFSDKELTLLQTFADQAVIAIENARLFNETREALEQQTATAEVLQVINSSPGNLEPVFEAMLERALRLCEADAGFFGTYDGEHYSLGALRGLPPEVAEAFRAQWIAGPGTQPMHAESGAGRIERGETVVHILDSASDAVYRSGYAGRRLLVEVGGARTQLCAALRKDSVLLGVIIIWRREVRPFTEKQMRLLENFAAQAVIAMENARLLGELRERTADLARSVDELSATGDVLKIISRSSVDLETVLETLVETVARLCRADQTFMWRRRDDLFNLVAAHGLSPDAKEFIFTHPPVPGRGTISGRAALERRAVHIPDVLQDPEYTYSEGQKLAGFRSMLAIPLLREDVLIGVFSIHRTRVEPFTSEEIELATTFADQAVIAIENARLFEELRDRQAELRVTFDNMGDGVVMFGADTRLVAWNRNFQEILDLSDVFLAERPSYTDYFRYLAERGEYSADLEAELSRTLDDTSQEIRLERTRPDGRVIEVRRNPVPGGGFVLIYADITERKRAEETVRAARDAAETALRELQKTQASLVHAQKMAALGQLTAGIAHEIKNPLNFVNNFAGLSVELLDELKQAAAQAIGVLDSDKRAEIVETIEMLTGNLKKIAEHGRRADGIVRGMLQHSRGSSGDWQATDLNALVEESLNLAYHGARAQDQDFKVALELDLDRKLAPIEIVPQDVSRVLLNLLSNGFYAVTKRGREGDAAFRPLLKIATREFGESVEIRVRDNGVGIPSEHCEKLFQPFFTTKPTGEGTGLGLSISYEIITQQHGGSITVDSEVGDFTEFTVRLPRRRRAVAG